MIKLSSQQQGILFGLAAALCWGVYNVGTERAQLQGFRPADLTFLRFGGAALFLLPLLWLARHRLPPFRQILMLSLLAGPLFTFAFNYGYRNTPLAHAVVIGPGVSMLVANLLVWLLDRRKPSRSNLIGMAVLVCGLIIIAYDKPPPKFDTGLSWFGDLCFVVSGSLWGGYIYLLGRWKLPAIETTASVASLIALVFTPLWLLVWGIPAIALAGWGEQIFIQGAIGGCLAILVFTAAVLRLGTGQAAVFSALVPATAVILAIPMTAVWPNLAQWIGLLVTSIGLVISLDLGRRPAAAREK